MYRIDLLLYIACPYRGYRSVEESHNTDTTATQVYLIEPNLVHRVLDVFNYEHMRDYSVVCVSQGPSTTLQTSVRDVLCIHPSKQFYGKLIYSHHSF